MTKRKAITAEELMAQLEADPEYLAKRGARNQRREQREAEVEVASRPLLSELAQHGYPAVAVHELAERYAPLPPTLVGILLNWLPKVEDIAVQEQIVRALAVTRTPFDGSALTAIFELSESNTLRWAVANTIAEAKPTNITQWVLGAVSNPSFGKAREMLAVAVARLAAAPLANSALLPLLDELPIHAAWGLAESGQESELRVLEACYGRASGLVKKEMGRAISVIRRRLGVG